MWRVDCISVPIVGTGPGFTETQTQNSVRACDVVELLVVSEPNCPYTASLLLQLNHSTETPNSIIPRLQRDSNFGKRVPDIYGENQVCQAQSPFRSGGHSLVGGGWEVGDTPTGRSLTCSYNDWYRSHLPHFSILLNIPPFPAQQETRNLAPRSSSPKGPEEERA